MPSQFVTVVDGIPSPDTQLLPTGLPCALPAVLASHPTTNFGEPTVLGGVIAPAPIDSGEDWGTPSLSKTVYPSPIDSGEGWGTPSLDIPVRLTQASVAILSQYDPPTRLTQQTVQALAQYDPPARLTQQAVQVIAQYDPPARLTAAYVNVIIQTVTAVGDSRDATWDVKTIIPRQDRAQLWLMADQGVSVDGFGGTTSWADQSGNGRDATQASTFARPAEVTGALNGLPVLRFDGSTDHLNVSSSVFMLNSGDQFAFAAVVADSRADTGLRNILSNYAATTGGNELYVATVGQSPTRAVVTEEVGGANDGGAGRGDLDSPADYFILIVTCDANNQAGQVSVFQGSTLVYTDALTLPSRDFSTSFAIGRRGTSPSQLWNGDLAEMIVWDVALDEDEVQDAFSYLDEKWFGQTQAGQTADTTWNVEEAEHVGQTADTTWNVAALPNVTASTTWSVEVQTFTTVGDDRDATWDVHQVVGDDRDTTWNAEESDHVTKTADTTWNVEEREHVGQDADTSWNVRRPVTRSASTSWNVRRVVGRIRSTLWNDRALVPVAHATTWNTLELAGDDRDTTWDSRQAVGILAFPQPENRSRWMVYRISDTVVNQWQYAEWNVLKSVSASATTTWETAASVTATRATTWRTLVVMSDGPLDVDTTWGVRKAVGIQLVSRWNVFHLTYLHSTFWNTCRAVRSTRLTRWKVISYNNNSSDTYWNVGLAATRSKVALWNVRVPVRVSAGTTWRQPGPVRPVSPISRWNVLRNRPRVMTTYWNVRKVIVTCPPPETTQVTNRQIRVRWKVAAPNSGGAALRHTTWSVSKAVGRSRVAWWFVRATVGASAQAVWRVARFTTGTDIATTWDTRAVVGKSASAAWSTRQLITIIAPDCDLPTNRRQTWWAAEGVNSLGMNLQWCVRQLAPQSGDASWEVREAVGVEVGTSFVIVGENNNSAATTWAARAAVGASRNIQFGVFLPMTGDEEDRQRGASWTVRNIVHDYRSTGWGIFEASRRGATWGVRQAISATGGGGTPGEAAWETRATVAVSAEVVWYIGVGTSAATAWGIRAGVNTSGNGGGPGQAVWNNREGVAAGAGGSDGEALWNDLAIVGAGVDPDLRRQTTWSVSHVVAATRAASWDYSTVTAAAGTTWGVRMVVSTSGDSSAGDGGFSIASRQREKGGTLWTVFPACGPIFVKGDRCNIGDPACPTTGLVPRVTVCELERDNKKGYRSRIVRGKFS